MSLRPAVAAAFALSMLMGITACASDVAGVETITGPIGESGKPASDHGAPFIHAPIALRDVARVLPLGTLGGDGALPSPSARVVTTRDRVDVVAVADGVVTERDAATGCMALRVGADIDVRYCGVIPAAAVAIGSAVRAGTSLGVSGSRGSTEGVRIRILDRSVNRSGWVRPERYGTLRHASFFVRYLPADIRSEMFALVKRAGPDLDGRIEYDRAGLAVGTWFDHPPAAPSVVSGGVRVPADVDPSAALAPHALTFAYDAERPGQTRIAIGAALSAAMDLRGVYGVAWEDADPATLDVAAGAVRYTLFPVSDEERSGPSAGALMVQMVDASTMRVEAVPSGRAGAPAFSPRAITLVR